MLLKPRALNTVAAWASLAFFASTASGNAADVERLARLEFNGFVTLGRTAAFNLSEPDRGWTAWVVMDGESAGVSVLAFDREARLLTVAMGEETRQIPLKEDKIRRLALPALSRGSTSPVRDAARELERLEQERKMANLVGFDMALNHMDRKQRERERLRERALKARAALANQ